MLACSFLATQNPRHGDLSRFRDLCTMYAVPASPSRRAARSSPGTVVDTPLARSCILSLAHAARDGCAMPCARERASVPCVSTRVDTMLKKFLYALPPVIAAAAPSFNEGINRCDDAAKRQQRQRRHSPRARIHEISPRVVRCYDDMPLVVRIFQSIFLGASSLLRRRRAEISCGRAGKRPGTKGAS